MGERVTVYDEDDEGWSWGQLDSDRYVGWLPSNALQRPGPDTTHQRVGPAHVRVSRAVDQAAADLGTLSIGARFAIARHDERFAVTASGGYLPESHVAPLGLHRDRLRRGRRALRRRALSVGRQDQSRPRLFGAGAGRARRLRHLVPARQRHAGGGARHAGRHRTRTSPTCGAATWCSGKAMSRSRAIRRRWSTPMPFTWRWRSSRCARRWRESRRRQPAHKHQTTCEINIGRRGMRRSPHESGDLCTTRVPFLDPRSR